jgi:serine/threonine protein kinase
MKFLLHNEEGIVFPPIRPAYEEGELLFERFRTLTPRDAKDSIIGEGGTGLIHLVRDELMDRIVALKLPHENILRDPSARFDVIRETRQAIELTHPNIVRIHDFHEQRGTWGISMQYVRGKNLDEWRHEGRGGSRRSIVPYAVERIEGWIAQLCNALIYAHEDAHMVHRDIKPKNLMLERREDGYEKLLLTDFGITQKIRLHTMLLSRVQPGANEKSTMGTLPYMPWEQIQGAPASILDDVYSVGATIYELLTGRPPFYEGAYEQIRTQVEKVVPPSMGERLRQFDLDIHSIPPHWEETVAACLAKRPEDRPQSMREILSRLHLGGPVAPVVEAPVLPVVSEAETNALQEELRLREEEVRSLQEELAGRAEEILALQSRADEAVSKAALLEQAVEDSRSALGEAEGEREQVIAGLRADVETKAAELAAIAAEAGQLRSQIAALGDQSAAGREELAALQTELAAARQAAAVAEAAAAQKLAAGEKDLSQRIARTESETAAKLAEAERAANERIARAQAEAAAQVEEAQRVAANATEAAEKAARRKSARALAEALAAAEVAKQEAAQARKEAAARAVPPAEPTS